MPDIELSLTLDSQIQKNQLYSGEWTIAVYSDNGNAQPIAYMREFNLIVGPQVTTTVTPTVTVPVTSTPTLETTSERPCACFMIFLLTETLSHDDGHYSHYTSCTDHDRRLIREFISSVI